MRAIARPPATWSVRVRIVAFEPVAATFRLLVDNTSGAPGAVDFQPMHMALSDRVGTAEMNIVGAGAGTNSLHAQAGVQADHVETIQCTTLDTVTKAEGIERVLLLKIDTEGHEISVLEGARELLAARRIELIQFEYNHRWIASRHYLRDAFELLQPHGYHIGKITPTAIEFYAEWHHELESWREGNYLACLEPWTGRFDRIQWWNG
jgi:FkbM family methyltransferase